MKIYKNSVTRNQLQRWGISVIKDSAIDWSLKTNQLCISRKMLIDLKTEECYLDFNKDLNHVKNLAKVWVSYMDKDIPGVKMGIDVYGRHLVRVIGVDAGWDMKEEDLTINGGSFLMNKIYKNVLVASNSQIKPRDGRMHFNGKELKILGDK
ncbi:MAG: hypothetical protein ACRC5T_01220 [Cetobacterium sp.]